MGENNVSVIIPTIQKNLSVLEKLVNLLNNDSAVSEILIINNSTDELILFSELKKVTVINQKENLYVNASWNLGIEKIKNDTFLIINDDILPVRNLCTKVMESGIFDKKTTGLIGINPEYITQNDRATTIDLTIPEEVGTLTFTSLNKYKGTGDWGSAFFGKKQNYFAIPKELKIIFGDNYLLYQNLNNGRINYQMTGLPFNHIHSLSSASPEFDQVIQSDIDASVKYVP